MVKYFAHGSDHLIRFHFDVRLGFHAGNQKKSSLLGQPGTRCVGFSSFVRP